MSEESEAQKKGADNNDPYAGKWYESIFRELVVLEVEVEEGFPAQGEMQVEDKGDDQDEALVPWAETCLLNGMATYSDFHGLEPMDDIDARRLGKILGSKLSFFSTLSENHPFWKSFTVKQIAELETKLELPGLVSFAIQFTAPFASQWTSDLREIIKRATDIVGARGTLELVDFYQGFARGMEFMVELRRRLQANSKKRDKDYNKRMAVYTFAFLHGDEIEKRKHDLSWPEITEMFSKEYDYKIEVEEDTIKKDSPTCWTCGCRQSRQTAEQLGEYRGINRDAGCPAVSLEHAQEWAHESIQPLFKQSGAGRKACSPIEARRRRNDAAAEDSLHHPWPSHCEVLLASGRESPGEIRVQGGVPGLSHDHASTLA